MTEERFNTCITVIARVAEQSVEWLGRVEFPIDYLFSICRNHKLRILIEYCATWDSTTCNLGNSDFLLEFETHTSSTSDKRYTRIDPDIVEKVSFTLVLI